MSAHFGEQEDVRKEINVTGFIKSPLLPKERAGRALEQVETVGTGQG